MSDKDAGTPRVFLVRHGETEWTISGRYTGRSDIPLTANGEHQVSSSAAVIKALEGNSEITEDIREWEYGAYEGLLTAQIRAARKEKGLDKERPWNIWVDGCEDGEPAAEVAARLDRVIAKIREIQGPYMHGEKGVDVVLIAHGHILRAFAKRWIGFELSMRLPMMLEPGAVGVLSYEHHKVDEPAFLLGVNMGGNE
ncbi:hypothetical protein G7Y89_g6683 [Cudoniella acicularis]|uniref:Phosphoglycerate mutase n=1 Tax=Cudoniella acicularis TaxID=354080 RepID=A0A8H4RNE7_9HELO|nr:hypothetical protein G7Y89_g6683 [Cudoniella acicularis]